MDKAKLRTILISSDQSSNE